jgi:general secretion pathway protein I
MNSGQWTITKTSEVESSNLKMKLGNSKKRNVGFTLMEVLVSMAILGIALTLILELFSGGLRSAKISEEYTKAIWYGKAKMEEMLSVQDLSEGVTEGSFDSQYAWRSEVKKSNPKLTVEEDGQASLPIDLYQIVVRVTWPSGSGQRSYEVESLRVFKSEDDTGEPT